MQERCDVEVKYDLETALKALREDPLQLVTYAEDQRGYSAFHINLKKIVKCCQSVHVEASIR